MFLAVLVQKKKGVQGVHGVHRYWDTWHMAPYYIYIGMLYMYLFII